MSGPLDESVGFENLNFGSNMLFFTHTFSGSFQVLGFFCSFPGDFLGKVHFTTI